MKSSPKRLLVAVPVLMAAWLVGVVFATTDAGPAGRWLGRAVAQQAQRGSGPAAPLPTPPRQPPSPGSAMAETVYKNVQVLKGIPVDEFIGTMGVFSTSLTLCCGNCHTGAGSSAPDWADDAPARKKITRRMIQMVNDINSRNFQGRQVVTCWTCHRGQLSPGVTAPLDFAYGDPVLTPPDVLMKPASGGVPAVDQVFDQYVKALGGTAATSALTSYVAKGTSMLWGDIGSGSPAELYAKAPDSLAAFVHQREGDVARSFNGTTAWFQLPLTVTPQYQLTKTMAEGGKFDAAMAFPWRVRTFFTNWRVSFTQRVNDVEVNVLQGSTPAGMIGTLYIDKKTGLLVRMLRYANTAVGRIPTQYDYDDYRPVAGVMMPFKITYTWVSQREVWTLAEYQPNVAIDASRFGRPANPDRTVAPVKQGND